MLERSIRIYFDPLLSDDKPPMFALKLREKPLLVAGYSIPNWSALKFFTIPLPFFSLWSDTLTVKLVT